jgi:DNA ligase-1
MEYGRLADVYERLEATPSKLGKRDLLAELFRDAPAADLEKIVLLATGQVFPSYSEEELGVAEKMMRRAIEKATGHSESQVVAEFKRTGDFGLTAENFVNSNKQSTLMRRKLTVDKVFESLQELPAATGAGSQDRKLGIVAELVSSATPKEAKYIVRTALGTLRIGVAEGIVRDAIAKAFGVEAANVEHAWNMSPDYGRIATIAKRRGDDGLKKVGITLGVSLQVLLAEKAPDLKTALEAFERPIVEVKYDGARVQIHKDGGRVMLFTRRLEEVTRQFPDIVEFVKENVRAGTCILDCEAVGVDRRTGRPLPFQQLSQRVRRKHDIERMAEELPVQVNVFDALYIDGRSLLEERLSERRAEMKKIIKVVPGKFQFTEHVITKDLEVAERFYRHALEIGEEGVMVKNLDSKYIPGRRVGYWLKVKPTMEPLDLVVIGAEWGTGKRVNWLSSYVLGCRDPATGNFLRCGMMGTGLTDEQFKEMTRKLKPLVLEERGRSVTFKPSVVFEIGYQEIQRSPTYDSGFALRFPVLLRDRSADKGPEEADTIGRVRKLYESQRKKS